jgi:hypothetical protein
VVTKDENKEQSVGMREKEGWKDGDEEYSRDDSSKDQTNRKTDGQKTDGQTDGRTDYCAIVAAMQTP